MMPTKEQILEQVRQDLAAFNALPETQRRVLEAQVNMLRRPGPLMEEEKL